MPGQLSYTLEHEKGSSGDPADSAGGVKDGLSRVTVNDTIPFGRGVVAVSGQEDECALPSASGDIFLGIARRVFDIEGSAYIPNTQVCVERKGRWLVEVDQDVVAGDDVFVRYRSDPHVITLTFSGNLITGNTINGDINGTAIAAVPFNTSDAQTVQDFADAVAALSDLVASAIVTGTDEVTVTGKDGGVELTGTFLVTGGVSQATVAQATVSGPSTGTEKGIFRKDDDDTNAGGGPAAFQVTQAAYLEGASAGGNAVVEINLP